MSHVFSLALALINLSNNVRQCVHRLGKMTAMPTVDQLPSFMDTASYLANDRFQLIKERFSGWKVFWNHASRRHQCFKTWRQLLRIVAALATTVINLGKRSSTGVGQSMAKWDIRSYASPKKSKREEGGHENVSSHHICQTPGSKRGNIALKTAISCWSSGIQNWIVVFLHPCRRCLRRHDQDRVHQPDDRFSAT